MVKLSVSPELMDVVIQSEVDVPAVPLDED